MNVASPSSWRQAGSLRPSRGLRQRGMVERVALEMQRHQRVDPGRLDAAPGAVGVLMAHDPFDRVPNSRRAPQRELSPGAERLQGVQNRVGAAEEAIPAARVGLLGQFVVEVFAARGKQRVEAPFRRQRADRAARREQGYRHQRRARPLREIVDREREPQWEPDHLGRQVGRLLPRPFADQRQPVAGEHADVAQTALGLDPGERLDQRRVVWRRAQRAQCGVTLDGGVDVAVGRVVVNLPGAVGPLRLADRRAEPGAQRVGLQLDHPQGQAPLRLHAGVAVGAGDPMAVGLLARHEPVGRRAGGGGEGVVEIGAGRRGVHRPSLCQMDRRN